MITPGLDAVADAMLAVLQGYLPPAPADLPAGTVSVAEMRERAVGIGRMRGSDSAGPFAAISRKGVRLDAVARFQLWATDPSDADQGISDLNMRLLADQDALRAAGFLRFALEGTPTAESIVDLGWRRYADYRVLYEFDYQDSDDALGLIARIPVALDGEFSEQTTVTDELTRWDNRAAPPLVVRGPFGIGGLAMLAFIPGPFPSGRVVLTRTFDGAAGNPASYANLPSFLAAVAGPNPVVRHARVSFANMAQFRAAFHNAGAILEMGDWNLDGIPDAYRPLALSFASPIQLVAGNDRFEATYAAPKFDQTAVVYLRLTRF